MRLVHTGMDNIVIEIDPVPGERPGAAQWQYVFDQDVFATMVLIANEEKR